MTFLNEPELIFFFLHTVKCFQVLLFNANNSIKHQLNDKTVLFTAIQFSISTQFECQTFLFDP